MSFSDLLRSFLGLPKFEEFGPGANEFRDPFWDVNSESSEQWNDEVSAEQEYDVGIFDPRSPFNEPFEMLRRFEEMFQHFAFPDVPSGSSPQLKESEEEPVNPRARMLKSPEKDSGSEANSSLVARLWDSKGVTSEPVGDHDLDEEVASGKIPEVLQTPKIDVRLPQENSFFYKSVTVKKVHLPDGRIEEQKVFKDSDGNEETVIKRTIGDKSHLVKNRTNKGNVVITEEEYMNLDERSLTDFEKKWEQPKRLCDETLRSEAQTVSEQPKDSSYFNFFQKFLGYAP